MEWILENVPDSCGRHTLIFSLNLDLLQSDILVLPSDLGFVHCSVRSLAKLFGLLVPNDRQRGGKEAPMVVRQGVWT